MVFDVDRIYHYLKNNGEDVVKVFDALWQDDYSYLPRESAPMLLRLIAKVKEMREEGYATAVKIWERMAITEHTFGALI